MNAAPTIPELTAVDAAQQLIAAAIYLAVGLAALAQAPRDRRTRVFAALAVVQVVALSMPVGAWWLGIRDPLAFDRVPLAILLAALSVSALLIFHFSQVFPTARPWIEGSGIQLPIAYALTPVAVVLLVRFWPGTPQQATLGFGLLFIIFGFPLMVLLGLVLPVASIVSLLRSLREEAIRRSREPVSGPDPRPAIAAILFSQFAGGVLSLLILGPMTAVAPGSPATAIVGITVWLVGLLTPFAYAAAIWKYGVLAMPPRSAEVKPN